MAACGASAIDRGISAFPGPRSMQSAHSHIFAATSSSLCQLILPSDLAYDHDANTSSELNLNVDV